MLDRVQMKAWQKDIVKFIEDVVWIPTERGVEKLRLWPFQCDILREACMMQAGNKPKYRILCLSLPKRNGKSLLGALVLLWKFVCFYNTHGVVCSNSYSQAKSIIFDLVKDIVRASPILLNLIGAENLLEDKILLRETRSQIICLSAKLQTAFGHGVTIGVIDEIHQAEDSGDGLFQILSSQCAERHGQIILPSQASSKMNIFYRLYQLAKEDKSIYFFYTDKNLSPLITDDFLTSRQRQMLPSQYRAFHQNEWSEGGEGLFKIEQISGCFDKEISLADFNTYIIGAGLDRALSFSKHADKTVVTFLVKGTVGHKEIFWVMSSAVIKFSDAGTIKKILSDARQEYGLTNFSCDVYQSQDICHWALAQGIKAEMLHLGRELQLPMFNLLYRIIDEGRLKFHPDLTLLKNELEVFSVDSSTNPPKFGGNPHDDAVYSLALALWSLREAEPTETDFNEVIKDIQESPDRITSGGFSDFDDEDREFLNPPSSAFNSY